MLVVSSAIIHVLSCVSAAAATLDDPDPYEAYLKGDTVKTGDTNQQPAYLRKEFLNDLLVVAREYNKPIILYLKSEDDRWSRQQDAVLGRVPVRKMLSEMMLVSLVVPVVVDSTNGAYWQVPDAASAKHQGMRARPKQFIRAMTGKEIMWPQLIAIHHSGCVFESMAGFTEIDGVLRFLTLIKQRYQEMPNCKCDSLDVMKGDFERISAEKEKKFREARYRHLVENGKCFTCEGRGHFDCSRCAAMWRMYHAMHNNPLAPAQIMSEGSSVWMLEPGPCNLCGDTRQIECLACGGTGLRGEE